MIGVRRVCLNSALVITSVLITILFCEVGLRLAGFTNPSEFKQYHRGTAARFYFAADPVLGHDIVPNFSGDVWWLPDYIRTYGAPFPVSSNSLGCRDRPFEPEDDYTLLIGDSYTWGYVGLEETWGATLEQLIDRRVLKCGVPGYGPRQQRQKLANVVAGAGRPRLVIVGYVMNDLLDDYLYPSRTVTDGYLVDQAVLAHPVDGGRHVRSEDTIRARMQRIRNRVQSLAGRMTALLSKYSILYDRLEHAEALRPLTTWIGIAEPPNPLDGIHIFRPVHEFPWLTHAWEQHLENLRHLKSAVEELDAALLVVIFPDPRQLYHSLRPSNGNFEWEYPNQKLTEFFQREQIAFVDLLPEFRRYVSCRGRSMPTTQDDLYWANDDHPNVQGNYVAGLLIGRHVLEQSLVQVPNRSRRLSDLDQLLSTTNRCRTTASIR